MSAVAGSDRRPSVVAAARRVVIPLAVCAAFVWLDRPLPATVVGVVAALFFAVGIVRPAWADRFDRFLLVVAARLAEVIGWVALSAVWLLAIAPAWVVARLVRREALRPAGGSAVASWNARDAPAPREGSGFVDERTLDRRTPRHRLARRIPAVVGAVVLLVALDGAAGWTYDALSGGGDDTTADDRARLGGIEGFAASPAAAGQNWAVDYADEYRALTYRYEPYVLTMVEDADGPLITVRDGVRRSYEPVQADASTPVVWIFGGSLVFGQGQRDEHTIPSALARAFERAGTPVRAINHGQPGYTTWQQWQHFERLLARDTAPAAVVFLGGYDDVRVQVEGPSSQPTHYNVNGAGASLAGEPPITAWGDLVEEYQDRSAVNRIVGRVGDLIGTAGAAEADGPPDPGTAAAGVHRRARLFIDHLGERQGVEVLAAWQPAPVAGPVVEPYEQMVALTDDSGVVDLSRLLVERPELFVDDRNLGEEGARVVAEALRERLADRLDLGP